MKLPTKRAHLAVAGASLALLGATGSMAADPPVFSGCHKVSCDDDPAAWAAMLGSRPQDRAARANAEQAILALARRRQAQANAASLRALLPVEREELAVALEQKLTEITSQPATVIRATMKTRGMTYLFCGAALYGSAGDGGIFVLDQDPAGMVKSHADRGAFVRGGCSAPGPAVRLR